MKIPSPLKYLDYCLVLPLSAKLPRPLAYQIADWRGWIRSKVRNESRRFAEKNLSEIFPNLDSKARKQLVLQYFQTMTRDELDGFWCRQSLGFLEKFVEVSGFKELKAAVEEGHGVLFFSGHFGSLGFCWCVVGKMGIPLTVVARSIEPEETYLHPAARMYNRRKVAWIENAITRPFVLTRRGNYPVVKKRLTEGEVMMIAIDVLPDIVKPKRTVIVDFLGKPAIFADGIASLYKSTRARLVQYTIFADRSRNRHRIELRDVTKLVDRSGTKQQIVQRLARFLEEKILENPQEWHVWDSVSLYRPDNWKSGDGESGIGNRVSGVGVEMGN